jgi:hypothetical protein
VTALLVVVLHGEISPTLAGLSLAYVSALGGMFQFTTRLQAEVSIDSVCVCGLCMCACLVCVSVRAGI